MKISKTLAKAITRDAAARSLDVKIAAAVVGRILMREQDPGRPDVFTLPQLLKSEFWSKYEFVGRRIGLFVARMSRAGDLPIKLVRVRSDGHRVYAWRNPRPEDSSSGKRP